MISHVYLLDKPQVTVQISVDIVSSWYELSTLSEHLDIIYVFTLHYLNTYIWLLLLNLPSLL